MIELVQPFTNSAQSAFETMLDWQITEPGDGSQGTDAEYAFSGVVGVAGGLCGSVVLRLGDEAARRAAAEMLEMELDEVEEDDVVDAVGELANMVVGCAKSKLADHQLTITVPNVITGQGHKIKFAHDVETLTIPLRCEFGPIAVKMGLKPVEAASLA